MRLFTQVKKFAIFCHRWMGVTFCLLFAWWFISGIFMMYWEYPEVSDADRLEHAEVLDASRVRISPVEAYAALKSDTPPDALSLRMFDGRPAYRFRAGREQRLVFADTGEMQTEFSSELNLRTAATWAARPPSQASAELVNEPDQWTFIGGFSALRPLTKYSWPNGEQVYVSQKTGQVVQHTTRSSRLFAHLGVIPHWLYYVPLRTNEELWSTIIIWGSGVGTIMALMGLIVGVWMYSPSKRYRMAGAPTSIPYAGQKRLHMIFGLFFGIVACTWAFSGMLSMDPFPIPAGDAEGSGGGAFFMAGALRSGVFEMEAYAPKHPREALERAASSLEVKELEFTSFLDDPAYLAREAPGRSLVIPLEGEPAPEFDHARIVEAIRTANEPTALAEVKVIGEYDAYYIDRHGERPLPVLLLRLDDEVGTRLYIDPRTADLVGGYSTSPPAWVDRWLFHGLHSLDFPWLYKYRPAWDIVVLVLMLGGTTLCITGIIIGFQLLRRKLSWRANAVSRPEQVGAASGLAVESKRPDLL